MSLPHATELARRTAFRVRPGRAEDHEALARLLHRTFASELRQHPENETATLVDKFDHKNTYFVAERDGCLIGAIAVHDRPPFSVERRLPDGLTMAQIANRPLEVRLLCVEPGERLSTVAFRLMAEAFRHARHHGHRELWISGVEEQLPLYARLGFEVLGPCRKEGEALFAPMRARLEQLPASLRRKALQDTPGEYWQGPLLSLLPGPPRLRAAVQVAAAGPALYHRDPAFQALYRSARQSLRGMQLPPNVALLPGGGTLANDTVAQALSRLPEVRTHPGVVLCNGEFGARLGRHAAATGTPHEVIESPWGHPWDTAELRQVLSRRRPAWVWGVHLDSSTGVLNPAQEVADLCRSAEIPFALDCASSLGATSMPSGVDLVASVSGKSLGSVPGIAIIAASQDLRSTLHAEALRDDSRPWPLALDLPEAWAAEEPPHTLASQLLRSLVVALERPTSRKHLANLGAFVREQLTDAELRVLAEPGHEAPNITTFAVPHGLTTMEFLRLVRRWGFQLAGRSRYLRQRRLAQVATMGEYHQEELQPLFDRLKWLSEGS